MSTNRTKTEIKSMKRYLILQEEADAAYADWLVVVERLRKATLKLGTESLKEQLAQEAWRVKVKAARLAWVSAAEHTRHEKGRPR